MNLDSFNNINDIKNILVQQKNKLEKEKEEKIKKAKQEIELIIIRNADIAREQDEKKKDILKFLSSIGFDLIPQSITDNVINQLNLNTALRAKLGFTMEIDIKN